MILGPSKRKWRIARLSPDYRDEERIGVLIEGEDFYLFAPSDPRQETIVYQDAFSVKEKIKLNYGSDFRYTIGNVETFF